MHNIKPEFINAKKTDDLNERAMFLRDKIRLMTAMCLLATSSFATALPGDENKTSAFVDSVYEWGTWELGVEPAAGGLAPMSNRALNVRLANVKFRPNDNTTFSPGASRVAVTTPVAPAVLPPVVTPPIEPPVRVSPSGTSTSPGDRF